MSEESKKPSPTKTKFNLLKKLKLSKNSSIAIAIVLSLVALLIFCSSFEGVTTSSKKTTTEYTSMLAYTKTMENKLKKVVSAIEGVGDVEVMITFDSSVELVIATTKESKTTMSGSSQTTITIETPVLVNKNGESKPIVLQEKLPQPQSVFIVANGAENTNVKLDIIRAVEVLFALPSSKIEVLAGK